MKFFRIKENIIVNLDDVRQISHNAAVEDSIDGVYVTFMNGNCVYYSDVPKSIIERILNL